MGDQMAGILPKVELEDYSRRYDLEYKASEDDAWYSVYVVLDAAAEKLTVKYWSSPPVYEVVLSAAEFRTEAEVEELVRRFRPPSRRLQDHQCGTVAIGTSVCAAHGTDDEDFRFYDAIVKEVKRKSHSLADGEEECLCRFLLVWQNGRGRGTLTLASIASICIADPATQIDPRISAFSVMAKKRISSSSSISTKMINSESPQNGYLEMDSSIMPKSPTMENEDSGRTSNYNGWTSQDDDVGPRLRNTNFILISNLEKDLTASSIIDFIYKQTNILPQAFVFPRLLSDPFARGAIMVDSQKKGETIFEFLENPLHLVVSSRGRPWVVTEKASVETFGENIWNLIPNALEVIKYERPDEKNGRSDELQVVPSGTESFNRAKQLWNLCVEYIHHESELCKRLIFEEKRILQSSQPV